MNPGRTRDELWADLTGRESIGENETAIHRGAAQGSSLRDFTLGYPSDGLPGLKTEMAGSFVCQSYNQLLYHILEATPVARRFVQQPIERSPLVLPQQPAWFASLQYLATEQSVRLERAKKM